jgi:hypothetical protein
VRDGLAARQFLLGAVLVNVNPLLVTGCLSEFVDAVLRDLDPFAGADLGADR